MTDWNIGLKRGGTEHITHTGEKHRGWDVHMIEVIKTVLAVIGGLTVASAVAMAIIIFKR